MQCIMYLVASTMQHYSLNVQWLLQHLASAATFLRNLNAAF